MGGNRAPGFVIVQGPERNAQRSGQDRPAVLSVKGNSDIANPGCQVALERSPIRVVKMFFHGGPAIWRRIRTLIDR